MEIVQIVKFLGVWEGRGGEGRGGEGRGGEGRGGEGRGGEGRGGEGRGIEEEKRMRGEGRGGKGIGRRGGVEEEKRMRGEEQTHKCLPISRMQAQATTVVFRKQPALVPSHLRSPSNNIDICESMP